MNFEEKKYQRFIIPLEEYPRVHYFRARIKDFEKRFKRVLDGLPRCVRDEHVMQYLLDLNNVLDKLLHIVVIGEESLSREDLCVPAQYTGDTENISSASCTAVIICYAVVETLDLSGVKKVVLAAQQISTVVQSIDDIDTVILFCKTEGSSQEDEIIQFRDNVHRELKSSIAAISVNTTNIIISTEFDDLKNHISLLYETRVVEGFIKIRSFLSQFVTNIRREPSNPIRTQEQKPMFKATLEFLRNGFNICDIICLPHDRKYFLSQIIERLARHVRCTITAPVASKHAMPHWLCARLLNEIELENTLVQSVSNKSRYLLCKLERLFVSAKRITEAITNDTSVSYSKVQNISHCLEFDFLLDPLHRDFEDAALKTENVMSSAKRLLVVMGKMIYEIDGYLKQSEVQQIPIPQNEPVLKIPDSLRQNILAISGVYGIGTVYGGIEVHVLKDEKHEDVVSTLLTRLHLLMREHNLHNAYRIKHVKQ